MVCFECFDAPQLYDYSLSFKHVKNDTVYVWNAIECLCMGPCHDWCEVVAKEFIGKNKIQDLHMYAEGNPITYILE